MEEEKKEPRKELCEILLEELINKIRRKKDL